MMMSTASSKRSLDSSMDPSRKPLNSIRAAPAAEPDAQPAVRQVVKHTYRLHHSKRVVPWQDDRRCAQCDPVYHPGEVRQHLHVVRDHRVPVEVVLGGPHHVISQVVRQPGQLYLLAVDLGVRDVRPTVACTKDQMPNVHKSPAPTFIGSHTGTIASSTERVMLRVPGPQRPERRSRPQLPVGPTARWGRSPCGIERLGRLHACRVISSHRVARATRSLSPR